MKQIGLFFLLFSTINTKGQYIKIKNKDGIVLPFCSLGYGFNKFLQTNQEGVVKLEIDIDSVDISFVGYKNYKLYGIRNKLKIQDTISVTLEKNISKQESITVLSFTNVLSIGVTKVQKNTGFTFMKGGINLLKVKNPKKFLKIESFFINITKGSSKSIPFKIRIMSCDSMGFPNYDLYDSSILVNKYNIGKWTEINLSSYNIIVKEKYFFIGIELVGNDQESLNNVNSNKFFQIAMSKEMDESNQFSNFPFIGWKNQVIYYSPTQKDKFWNPAYYVKAKTTK
jgi:hypothetical protein